MEKFKHKNGTGTMFFNEKQNDKQPDIKGTLVTPDGQEYRVSGWKKSGIKGEYYSLAIDTYQKQEGNNSNGLPF